MSKVQGFFVSCILAYLAFAFPSAQSGQEILNTEFPQVPQVLILSATGNHYPAITRALSTIGFLAGEVSPQDYGSSARGLPSILVIPEREGRELDAGMVQTILREVDEGLPLLLDGPTALASELDVNASGARGRIKRYRWESFAQEPIRLPSRLTYSRVNVPPRFQVLAVDEDFNSPLVVAGSRAHGRFLYSAIPLEPEKGMVFQYLPFLAQAVVDQLHVAPTLGADNLCVYVDFGGEPRVDPVAVVTQLKHWSVREVHLGVFYQSEMFLKFLPRFLAAAHQQGIAVYAWLEYPMVSQEFWDAHPEWREVTASGHRAIMDWRLHMALEDPACFEAVAAYTLRLVLDYDWDGVDFAELYFEAERHIFEHPKDFTPMHPTFRRMFRERYGVDPIKIFDVHSPYYGSRNPTLRKDLADYRVELITDLTRRFMDVLADCKTEKPFLQTTLTFIDALRDPTVTERYGVEPARLLALQQQYGFGVEIEDPYTVWNSSPDRYRAIGEYYRPRLRPGTPFTLDVNVVDRMPPGRPLNRPRGMEFYELLANVASNVDLVTLYAYSTFTADDMRLAPYVLAAPQITSEFTRDGVVTAARQIYWQTDTLGRRVLLDGRDWPCHSDAAVLIPAGVHRVATQAAFDGGAPSGLRIEGVNGTVLEAGDHDGRVTLRYESRWRCYVILNRAPAAVLCDGKSDAAHVLIEAGRVCVVLPEGKHAVEFQ